MRVKHWLLILITSAAFIVISGCSEELETASFPDFVVDAVHPGAMAAYEYATTHGEHLEYIPCYCNCLLEPFYHKNTKDCFINSQQSIKDDIVYDPHGAG